MASKPCEPRSPAQQWLQCSRATGARCERLYRHPDFGAHSSPNSSTVTFPIHVAEHVTYLPRGTRLHLGDCALGFLGGAFSVDWRDRTPGIDWWQHEVTDTDDVARLGTERLDILISHEAPSGVNLLSSWRLPAEDQVRADDVRALVAQAAMATSPRLLIHGHWHHGYETELSWIDRAATERSGTLTWDSTRVVGLGCDGDTARGWIVLDLPTLDVTWPITDER